MQYGICALSIVPLRITADEGSAMGSQLLYGEYFKITDQRKHWFQARLAHDGTEGWVRRDQVREITEKDYRSLEAMPIRPCAQDLVAIVEQDNGSTLPVVLGATICNGLLPGHFVGSLSPTEPRKKTIMDHALRYLNAPYLQGGRSPFGIDSGGLAQMAYRLSGHPIARTAMEQAKQGQALSFIEECEAGDLAFFDNKDGEIDHVGIIMPENYIIHAYGKVRIDRLDHTGIFNPELGTYTHPLRVIKKVV